jgi:hypothetical protein
MDTPPAFALGDRVRTTIDVDSLWPGSDFPAGSLGWIQRLHSNDSYGVLLDDDPTRTVANFEADEIESAGGAR